MTQSCSASFVLRFRSLLASGRSYAFPCDASGRVDLDQLSERSRIDYFFARAMVGRELAVPAVELADPAAESTRPALIQVGLFAH